MQKIDEMDILLSCLFAVWKTDKFDDEKKKLRTGKVHLIPFFLQERDRVFSDLSFVFKGGPYSPILQNQLELAVNAGLVKAEEKVFDDPLFKKDDVYWISEKGIKWIEEKCSNFLDAVTGFIKNVVEYIIEKDYWELVDEAVKIWANKIATDGI